MKYLGENFVPKIKAWVLSKLEAFVPKRIFTADIAASNDETVLVGCNNFYSATDNKIDIVRAYSGMGHVTTEINVEEINLIGEYYTPELSIGKYGITASDRFSLTYSPSDHGFESIIEVETSSGVGVINGYFDKIQTSSGGSATNVYATDGSVFDMMTKADLVDGKVPLSQLGNIDTELFVVVTALPTEDIKTNKIYLVKHSSADTLAADAERQKVSISPVPNDPVTANVFDEYVNVNGAWELLGQVQTEVDLSGYATTESVATMTDEEIDAALAS